MNDNQFMLHAINEARIAFDQGEVPVGAIIVAQNRIIARAHNMVQTLSDPTAHAEMQAITSACATIGGKYLTDCTIYITLEPCPMCAAALGWAQVSKIVYGASDQKRGFLKFNPSLIHPKTEVVSGLMEAECGELVREFFAKKR